METSHEPAVGIEDRFTRTVALEGAEVAAVVPHVKQWHATHRADARYSGIRIVAAPDQSVHCTVAMDFTSREAAEALSEATNQWLEDLGASTGAVPSITLYRRVYTSREDAT